MKNLTLNAALVSAVPVAVALMIAGCADAPVAALGDGSSVHEMIAQQINDPAASERNGTTAPVGTDPDAANAAVQKMRTGTGRDASGAVRPSATDLIIGGR